MTEQVSAQTRRTFLKQAAIGTAAVLAYPSATVLGANDRVRVAMIGVGDRGNDLLDQIRAVQNVDLVAMADIYSRRREQAKSKVPGIQTFDDHRRVLDMKDIDAVIVASPLHIHSRHFLDTLAAGKDLYSEKTMTWSIPEADKCLAAAKSSNRVVQIGLQHQSSGSQADARQWIKDGWLGKVTQVESWMGRNTPHGKGQWVRPVPSDCIAQNVNWSAFLNGRPDRPVRSLPAHQLAFVLGILRRQLRREPGPPDRVDHGRARSAAAFGGLHVGWSLLRKRWTRSARHHRHHIRFSRTIWS